MSNFCVIREIADEYGADDGLMYPVPAPQTDAIVLEPRDGNDIKTVRCKSVRVHVLGRKKPTLQRLSDQLCVRPKPVD